MRNKWYVLGIGLAAALCAWGTIRATVGDMPLLAILPGALGIGLIIVAVRTARADSFGPAAKPRWDQRRSPAVVDWLKHRADQPHAKPTPPSTAPVTPKVR